MASELVPDDFDLQSAKRRESSTPIEQRPTCPECGSQDIQRKTGKPAGNGKRHPGQWRCCNQDCLTHFDDPDRGDRDA